MASSDDGIQQDSYTVDIYDETTEVTGIIYVEGYSTDLYATSFDLITTSVPSGDIVVTCEQVQGAAWLGIICPYTNKPESSLWITYIQPTSTLIIVNGDTATIHDSGETSNGIFPTTVITVSVALSASSSEVPRASSNGPILRTTETSPTTSSTTIHPASNTASASDSAATKTVCRDNSTECGTVAHSTGGHLTTAAIAGISVGCVCAMLILFTAIFLAFRYGRKKGQHSQQPDSQRVDPQPPSYPEVVTEPKALDDNAAAPDEAHAELPSIHVSHSADPAPSTVVSPLSSSSLMPGHRPWSPASFSSALSHPTSPLGVQPQHDSTHTTSTSGLDPGVHHIHELDVSSAVTDKEKSFAIYQ